MLIGFARVFTTEQNLDVQTDALNRAGCEKLFTARPAAPAQSGRVRPDARTSPPGRHPGCLEAPGATNIVR